MAVRELTYVKAYNEALHQVMGEDENVFVVGEDVAGYGGVFRMYDGLLEEYGARRMIEQFPLQHLMEMLLEGSPPSKTNSFLLIA